MPSSKRFQVRDRRKRTLGTFSRDEILQRIDERAFSGEEEIAREGGADWRPIASEPDFYDACLKRLYTSAYEPPKSSSQTNASSSSGDPKATRVSRVAKTVHEAHPKSEDSDAKTRQAEGREHGGTAQFSDFESLFSEPKDADPSEAPSPEPIMPEVPASEALEIDLPADSDPPMRISIATPAEVAESPNSQRKRLIIGTIVLLVLLLVFSRGTPREAKNDEAQEFSSLKTGDEKTRANILHALKAEARDLARSDVPLFYRGALNVLRQAFTIDSNDSEALGLFAEIAGYAMSVVPDPEKLREELTEVIRRGRIKDPQASVYYRAEARAAIARKDLDAAKQHALSAAESDPTSPENYLLVGELHYVSRDIVSARTAIEQAVRLTPTSVRAQFYAAKIAYDQADLAKAKAFALEALKLNPLHPPSYLVLGQVSEDTGQTGEARGLFETAGKLSRFTTKESAAEAYIRLAKIEAAQGDQALASQHYSLARFYSDETADQMKVSSAFSALGGEALKTLKSQEYGADYFKEQGQGLVTQRKFREAERFFQASSLLEPKDATSLLSLADVAGKTVQNYEDFQKVVVMYERAIERDPKNPVAYWQLGSLETDQYNFDRAQKLLQRALGMAPKRFEPYAALGKHFFKRQDYKQAISYFSQAEKLNPADSEVHYYAGMIRLLYGSDGARDAQVIFYKAYTLDPQNYDALVEWLKLRVAAFDKTLSIQFVSKLMEKEPQNPNLYWALGEIYAANKEYRRAIGYYHQSLDLDNRGSRVRMSLAKALEAIGDLEKAVAEYRLASRLDRRNSDGFFRAAEILLQAKSLNQAEEIVKYLIGVTPNYPGAQRLLSKVYQARNDKEGAIAAMEKEVANNPDNNRFVLELSELYINYDKYDSAVAELTKITNLPGSSKAPEYLYDRIRGYLLLSRAYRAQNHLDSAESAVRLALAIDGNDPELHRELGYVYYAQHRDKEGVKEFEVYLNRNPAARDSDAIRNLMKQMVIEE